MDILVDNMDKLAGTVIDSATDGGGVSLTPDQAAADYALIEKAADDYAKGIKAAADGLSTEMPLRRLQIQQAIKGGC